MHHLRLRKNFIAQHFLIGKDFGPENLKHSHQYLFELEIANKNLDAFNFVIDIVDIKMHIDKIIACFNDKTLNELPEFAHQNPSLELFSRILWEKFSNHSPELAESLVSVSLWEDDIAQAIYQEKK